MLCLEQDLYARSVTHHHAFSLVTVGHPSCHTPGFNSSGFQPPSQVHSDPKLTLPHTSRKLSAHSLNILLTLAHRFNLFPIIASERRIVNTLFLIFVIFKYHLRIFVFIRRIARPAPVLG